MSTFNPDAFLDDAPSVGFDPDAFLREQSPDAFDPDALLSEQPTGFAALMKPGSFAKPEPEKDFWETSDVISGVWDAVKGLGVTAPAAFYQLTEGMDRPDQYSDAAKNAFKEAEEYALAMEQKTLANRAAGTSSSAGESLREAGASLGFSLGSLAAAWPAAKVGGAAGAKIGAGIAAAAGVAGPQAAVPEEVATVPAGAQIGAFIGGTAAAMAASGGAAYRMAGAQFLNEAFRNMEQEAMATEGRPMTEQEKVDAYNTLLPIAKNTALWEAGPEAVGNAVTLGVGKLVFGKGMAKTLEAIGAKSLTKAAGTMGGRAAIRTGAVAGDVLFENATEALTNIEQSADQLKAQAVARGADPDKIKADWSIGSYVDSYREMFPNTVALMALMGGGATAAKGASKGLEKSLEALGLTQPADALQAIQTPAMPAVPLTPIVPAATAPAPAQAAPAAVPVIPADLSGNDLGTALFGSPPKKMSWPEDLQSGDFTLKPHPEDQNQLVLYYQSGAGRAAVPTTKAYDKTTGAFVDATASRKLQMVEIQPVVPEEKSPQTAGTPTGPLPQATTATPGGVGTAVSDKPTYTNRIGKRIEYLPNGIASVEASPSQPAESHGGSPQTKSETDFSDPDTSYRVVHGDDAFADLVRSGVVRTNYSEKNKIDASLSERLMARPTRSPSFSKGSASMSYAASNPNHYIIETNDSSLQASKQGRHGKGKTFFPTDENGVAQDSLDGKSVRVYKHTGDGNYALVYANGKVVSIPTSTGAAVTIDTTPPANTEQKQAVDAQDAGRQDDEGGQAFNADAQVEVGQKGPEILTPQPNEEERQRQAEAKVLTSSTQTASIRRSEVDPQSGDVNIEAVSSADGGSYLITASLRAGKTKWMITAENPSVPGEYSRAIPMDQHQVRRNVAKAIGERAMTEIEEAHLDAENNSIAGSERALAAIEHVLSRLSSKTVTAPAETVTKQPEASKPGTPREKMLSRTSRINSVVEEGSLPMLSALRGMSNRPSKHAFDSAQSIVASVFGNGENREAAIDMVNDARIRRPEVTTELQAAYDAIRQEAEKNNDDGLAQSADNAAKRLGLEVAPPQGSPELAASPAPVSPAPQSTEPGRMAVTKEEFDAASKQTRHHGVVIENRDLKIGQLITVGNEDGTLTTAAYRVSAVTIEQDGSTRHYLVPVPIKGSKAELTIREAMRRFQPNARVLKQSSAMVKDAMRAIVQDRKGLDRGPVSTQIRNAIRAQFADMFGQGFADDVLFDTSGRAGAMVFDVAGSNRVHVNLEHYVNDLYGRLFKVDPANQVGIEFLAHDFVNEIAQTAMEEVGHKHGTQAISITEAAEAAQNMFDLNTASSREELVRGIRWRLDTLDMPDDAALQAFSGMNESEKAAVFYEVLASLYARSRTGTDVRSARAASRRYLEQIVKDGKGEARTTLLNRLIELANRYFEAMRAFLSAHKTIKALPPQVDAWLSKLDEMFAADGAVIPDVTDVAASAASTLSGELASMSRLARSQPKLHTAQRGLRELISRMREKYGEGFLPVTLDTTGNLIPDTSIETSFEEQEELDALLSDLNSARRADEAVHFMGVARDLHTVLRHLNRGQSPTRAILKQPRNSRQLFDIDGNPTDRFVDKNDNPVSGEVALVSDIMPLLDDALAFMKESLSPSERNALVEFTAEAQRMLSTPLELSNPAITATLNKLLGIKDSELLQRAESAMSEFKAIMERMTREREASAAFAEWQEALRSMTSLREHSVEWTAARERAASAFLRMPPPPMDQKIVDERRAAASANPNSREAQLMLEAALASYPSFMTPEAFEKARRDAERYPVLLNERLEAIASEVGADGKPTVAATATRNALDDLNAFREKALYQHRFNQQLYSGLSSSDDMSGLVSQFMRYPQEIADALRRVVPSEAEAILSGIRRVAELIGASRRLSDFRNEFDFLVLGSAPSRPKQPDWRNVNIMTRDADGKEVRKMVTSINLMPITTGRVAFMLGAPMEASTDDMLLERPDPFAGTMDAPSEYGTLTLEYRASDAHEFHNETFSNTNGRITFHDPKLVPQIVSSLADEIKQGSVAASNMLGVEPMSFPVGADGLPLTSLDRTQAMQAQARVLAEVAVHALHEGRWMNHLTVSDEVMRSNGFSLAYSYNKDGVPRMVKPDQLIPMPDMSFMETGDPVESKFLQMVDGGMVGNLVAELFGFAKNHGHNHNKRSKPLLSHDGGLTPAGLVWSMLQPKLLEFVALTKGLSIVVGPADNQRTVDVQKAIMASVSLTAKEEQLLLAMKQLPADKAPTQDMVDASRKARIRDLTREAYNSLAPGLEERLRGSDRVTQFDLAKKAWDLHLQSKVANGLFRDSFFFARHQNTFRATDEATSDLPINLRSIRRSSFEVDLRKHMSRMVGEEGEAVFVSLVLPQPALRYMGDWRWVNNTKPMDVLEEVGRDDAGNPRFKLLREGGDLNTGDAVDEDDMSYGQQEAILRAQQRIIDRQRTWRGNTLLAIFGGDVDKVLSLIYSREFMSPSTNEQGNPIPVFNEEGIDRWIMDQLQKFHDEEKRRGIILDHSAKNTFDQAINDLRGRNPEHADMLDNLLENGGTAEIAHNITPRLDPAQFTADANSLLTAVGSVIPSLAVVQGRADPSLLRDGGRIPTIAFVPDASAPTLVMPYGPRVKVHPADARAALSAMFQWLGDHGGVDIQKQAYRIITEMNPNGDSKQAIIERIGADYRQQLQRQGREWGDKDDAYIESLSRIWQQALHDGSRKALNEVDVAADILLHPAVKLDNHRAATLLSYVFSDPTVQKALVLSMHRPPAGVAAPTDAQRALRGNLVDASRLPGFHEMAVQDQVAALSNTFIPKNERGVELGIDDEGFVDAAIEATENAMDDTLDLVPEEDIEEGDPVASLSNASASPIAMVQAEWSGELLHSVLDAIVPAFRSTSLSQAAIEDMETMREMDAGPWADQPAPRPQIKSAPTGLIARPISAGQLSEFEARQLLAAVDRDQMAEDFAMQHADARLAWNGGSASHAPTVQELMSLTEGAAELFRARITQAVPFKPGDKSEDQAFNHKYFSFTDALDMQAFRYSKWHEARVRKGMIGFAELMVSLDQNAGIILPRNSSGAVEDERVHLNTSFNVLRDAANAANILKNDIQDPENPKAFIDELTLVRREYEQEEARFAKWKEDVMLSLVEKENDAEEARSAIEELNRLEEVLVRQPDRAAYLAALPAKRQKYLASLTQMRDPGSFNLEALNPIVDVVFGGYDNMRQAVAEEMVDQYLEGSESFIDNVSVARLVEGRAPGESMVSTPGHRSTLIRPSVAPHSASMRYLRSLHSALTGRLAQARQNLAQYMRDTVPDLSREPQSAYVQRLLSAYSKSKARTFDSQIAAKLQGDIDVLQAAVDEEAVMLNRIKNVVGEADQAVVTEFNEGPVARMFGEYRSADRVAQERANAVYDDVLQTILSALRNAVTAADAAIPDSASDVDRDFALNAVVAPYNQMLRALGRERAAFKPLFSARDILRQRKDDVARRVPVVERYSSMASELAGMASTHLEYLAPIKHDLFRLPQTIAAFDAKIARALEFDPHGDAIDVYRSMRDIAITKLARHRAAFASQVKQAATFANDRVDGLIRSGEFQLSEDNTDLSAIYRYERLLNDLSDPVKLFRLAHQALAHKAIMDIQHYDSGDISSINLDRLTLDKTIEIAPAEHKALTQAILVGGSRDEMVNRVVAALSQSVFPSDVPALAAARQLVERLGRDAATEDAVDRGTARKGVVNAGLVMEVFRMTEDIKEFQKLDPLTTRRIVMNVAKDLLRSNEEQSRQSVRRHMEELAKAEASYTRRTTDFYGHRDGKPSSLRLMGSPKDNAIALRWLQRIGARWSLRYQSIRDEGSVLDDYAAAVEAADATDERLVEIGRDAMEVATGRAWKVVDGFVMPVLGEQFMSEEQERQRMDEYAKARGFEGWGHMVVMQEQVRKGMTAARRSTSSPFWSNESSGSAPDTRGELALMAAPSQNAVTRTMGIMAKLRSFGLLGSQHPLNVKRQQAQAAALHEPDLDPLAQLEETTRGMVLRLADAVETGVLANQQGMIGLGGFTQQSLHQEASIMLSKLEGNPSRSDIRELNVLVQNVNGYLLAKESEADITRAFIPGTVFSDKLVKALLNHDPLVRTTFAKEAIGRERTFNILRVLDRGMTGSGGRNGYFAANDAYARLLLKESNKLKELSQLSEAEKKNSRGKYYDAAAGRMFEAIRGYLTTGSDVMGRAEAILRAFKQTDNGYKQALADAKVKRIRNFFFSPTYRILEQQKVYEGLRDQFSTMLQNIADNSQPALDAIQDMENTLSPQAKRWGEFLRDTFTHLREAYELQATMAGANLDLFPLRGPVGFNWEVFHREYSPAHPEPSISEQLQFERAPWLAGPNRNPKRGEIHIMDIDGLAGAEAQARDMLFRMNIQPAYEAFKNTAGSVEHVNRALVTKQEGWMEMIALGKYGPNNGLDSVAAARAISLMGQEIIRRDLSNQLPANRFMDGMQKFQQIGAVQALISLSQMWRQTGPGMVFYSVAYGGKANFGFPKLFAKYLFGMLASPLSKLGKGPGTQNASPSLYQNINHMVEKKSISDYRRTLDGQKDFYENLSRVRPSRGLRPPGAISGTLRPASDAFWAVPREATYWTMKTASWMLQTVLAKAEATLVRSIWAFEITKALNKQRVSSGLQPITVEEAMDPANGYDREFTGEMLDTASRAVTDVMAVHDQGKKGRIMQQADSTFMEVLRGILSTFANHQVSTSGNSYAGFQMVRHGDKASREEGARLIATGLGQNVMFQLFRYETMGLMLAAILAMMFDWDEEEEQNFYGSLYGINPDDDEATAAGKLTQWASLLVGGSNNPIGWDDRTESWDEDEKAKDLKSLTLRSSKELVNQIPFAGIGMMASTTLGSSLNEWALKNTLMELVPGDLGHYERAGLVIPERWGGSGEGPKSESGLERLAYRSSKVFLNDVSNRSTLTGGLSSLVDPLIQISNAPDEVDFIDASYLWMSEFPAMPRELRRKLQKPFLKNTDAKIWSGSWER